MVKKTANTGDAQRMSWEGEPRGTRRGIMGRNLYAGLSRTGHTLTDEFRG